MSCRKGLAIGKGKGYRNVIGKDPYVHAQSARGMKQAQRMPMFISSGNATFQKCEMQKPKGEQIYLPVKNQPKMLTKCVSCGTRYAKDRFLFDYCPVCKSKNLKEIKRGGKTQFQKGDAVKSKFTDAKGTILSKDPFAVKYHYNGRTYVRLSNPKYWQKGGKSANVLVSFTKGKETVWTTMPRNSVNSVAKEYGYTSKVYGGKMPKKVKEYFEDIGSGIKRGAEYVGEKAKEGYKWASEKAHENAVRKQEEHDMLEKMSNAELRTLAINNEDTSLFGSSNKYEEELVRRIQRRKEVDKHIQEAEKEKPDEGLF